MRVIAALDQGTTSSRCLLIDSTGRILAQDQEEFPQYYPQPGWVEQDAQEIWTSQYRVLNGALTRARLGAADLAAIGITNQRETTILWDRKSGKPLHRAIVWQCRRTAPYCDELKDQGLAAWFREKTGLVIDAYFSGTKLKWLLDHIPGSREAASRGDILFGTVDSWLIWKLSGGKVHATDYSNASRTLLFNIHTLDWDQEILELMDIPRAMLPQVVPSSGRIAETDPRLLGLSVPVSGVAGDQQAALFGQHCHQPGQAKNTYGTGCFLLMNTGQKAPLSQKGLLTTLAWGLQDPVDGSVKVDYALEGSIFNAGSIIQWFRDQLGLISRASESEALAASVEDTRGVYLVPAFAGLGTPYWDMYARGAFFGLTRAAGKAHLVRAGLEAMAYRVKDVARVMEEESGIALEELRVDGGASANNFLMQFQSDILGRRVIRPASIETTALGAGFLAGLAVGFWPNKEALAELSGQAREFHPVMDEVKRNSLYGGWQRAVERTLGGYTSENQQEQQED